MISRTFEIREAAHQELGKLLAAGVVEQFQDHHMGPGTKSLSFSQIRKSIEESEDIEPFGKMAPNKKTIKPRTDSHNSNYALVNYESNQQLTDDHTEVENNYENNTFSFEKLHWTDALELVLVGAAALCLIRYIRKYMKKRREREESARQAQLVSTLQDSIPMTSNVSPTAPMVPMLEDRTLQSNRGSSNFRLYKP